MHARSTDLVRLTGDVGRARISVLPPRHHPPHQYGLHCGPDGRDFRTPHRWRDSPGTQLVCWCCCLCSQCTAVLCLIQIPEWTVDYVRSLACTIITFRHEQRFHHVLACDFRGGHRMWRLLHLAVLSCALSGPKVPAATSRLLCGGSLCASGDRQDHSRLRPTGS